jgi:hypothetical protein
VSNLQVFDHLDKIAVRLVNIVPMSDSPKLVFLPNLAIFSSLIEVPLGLYNKTFYSRDLQIFVISWSVCPWQDFPA